MPVSVTLERAGNNDPADYAFVVAVQFSETSTTTRTPRMLAIVECASYTVARTANVVCNRDLRLAAHPPGMCVDAAATREAKENSSRFDTQANSPLAHTQVDRAQPYCEALKEAMPSRIRAPHPRHARTHGCDAICSRNLGSGGDARHQHRRTGIVTMNGNTAFVFLNTFHMLCNVIVRVAYIC